ncbi:MAG: carbon monoxide dehydrogenase subunit G [Chloroflexota bacterium]
MQFQGTVNIKAPRQKVWEFLTDPHQVSQCAPGVESVVIIEPNRKFRAVASIGLGSVKARFSGDAEFLELDAPHRAKIKGHGSAPGSAADVTSEMFLSDGPDGSAVLKWTADIVILGQLAGLAARMMAPVTQKLTGDFFNCVKKKIEA